ncbi:unnamed protein product, partial [Rotaria sordida]
LTNIFESFLPQLLAYPNPVDPLNGDAAALYLHKPEDYKKKVREYVQRFATADMAESLSAANDGHSLSNNKTNDLNNSNQTNKNESDDEILSDFSEDEAADMDLE